MTDTAEQGSTLKASLRLGGGFTLAIFGAGIVAGVIASAHEHGGFKAGGMIAIALALAAVAAGIWLVLSARSHLVMPRSPKMRRSRIALYLSLGVSFLAGALIGIAGHMTQQDDIHGFDLMFDSGPISSALAICAIAGWLIAIGVSAYWHRTLDEIERAEYETGATLGLYAYMLVAPAWWLAWRGGMAPEPDGVAIFMTVCVVWTLGWAWKRYR